ncbi:MAG: biotin/lipoyl-binding protein, partial [Saprospiraceae bacterium]
MKLPIFNTPIFGLALFLALLPGITFAHGDEILSDPGVANDHFTRYGQSDRYELTLYYPELVVGTEAHLMLYVADYKSNRPIDKAELKISTLENPQLVFEVAPYAPGVYELHTTFPENKAYTLNVQVSHPNGADLIGITGVKAGEKLTSTEEVHEHEEPIGSWLWFVGGLLLGGLVVWFVSRRRSRVLTVALLLVSAWFSAPNWSPVFAHDGEEHGPKQSSGGGYGKSVYAPKETQFLFEILTQPIAIGDYQSATTMFGTIVPASGGLGVVVAPQSGRLTKVSARVGQSVRAGQVLAVLQQTVSTPDQVDIAANNSGLAVQIETAKTRVTATKREYERLKKIED